MSLLPALQETWPARATVDAGGFVLRVGQSGKRLTCATPMGAPDIAAAEARFATLGQRPLFLLTPEDAALDQSLKAKGYTIADEVSFYQAPCAALAAELPPVRVFAHWPPLAIQAEIWGDADALAAMARVQSAKTTLLGRLNDRAAGCGFVALSGAVAMLHALTVLPAQRRQGLARNMITEAATWAQSQGAHHLALAVSRSNHAAIALYHSLGMQPAGQYHYRVAP